MDKKVLLYFATGLAFVAMAVFPSFITLGLFLGSLIISLDEGVKVVVSRDAVLKVEKSIHVSPHFVVRHGVLVKKPVGRPFGYSPLQAKRSQGRPRKIPLEMVS